jgi:hypothetical protein
MGVKAATDQRSGLQIYFTCLEAVFDRRDNAVKDRF